MEIIITLLSNKFRVTKIDFMPIVFCNVDLIISGKLD